MLSDPELSALLDQAARNLDTLELLARGLAATADDCERGPGDRGGSGEDDLSDVDRLRARLQLLKAAYTRETNALTRQVLQREVDRRVTSDRRQTAGQATPMTR